MFKRTPIPGKTGPSLVGREAAAQHATNTKEVLPPHPPRSIQGVNALPMEWKEALYRILIPSQVLTRFGIHPISLIARSDHRAVSFRFERGSSAFQLQVRHRSDAEDPLYLLELQDGPLGHVVVPFMATNDPTSPRFQIDRDEAGRPTLLGTQRRNLVEEERAMRAGLAPGQVRQGLRLMRLVMARVEAFLVALGQDGVIVEPIAYHSAILFERHGFTYTAGHAAMESIHQAFRPDGALTVQLDGSTPFRAAQAAESVRGRSWAIHDGVMGHGWEGVKMIKRLGPSTPVDTAPGLPW